jgi:hypothetical protein
VGNQLLEREQDPECKLEDFPLVEKPAAEDKPTAEDKLAAEGKQGDNLTEIAGY